MPFARNRLGAPRDPDRTAERRALSHPPGTIKHMEHTWLWTDEATPVLAALAARFRAGIPDECLDALDLEGPDDAARGFTPDEIADTISDAYWDALVG